MDFLNEERGKRLFGPEHFLHIFAFESSDLVDLINAVQKLYMELVQCAFAATEIKFTVQLVNIRNKKPALLYSAAASGRGIIPKYKLSSLELISLLLPHHRPLMPPFINGLEAEGLIYGRSLIR